MTREWQEASNEKGLEQKQNPFTGTLLNFFATRPLVHPLSYPAYAPTVTSFVEPAKHLFYNLNRCHSRRIRRQGPHTGQIISPLILPNERRTKGRLFLGRGLLSFRFPAVLVPSLLPRDSFRALTRRSSDVCLTSFPFVFIEERCSKTKVVRWLCVEE